MHVVLNFRILCSNKLFSEQCVTYTQNACVFIIVWVESKLEWSIDCRWNSL